MLSQLRLKFFETTRVFVFKLNSGGSIGVGFCESGHALLFQEIGADFVLFTKLLTFSFFRAIATARNRERQCPFRISEPKMQSCKAAHREANNVRFIDGERIHYRADVVTSTRLGVLLLRTRDFGLRPASCIISDCPMSTGEIPHLRLPTAMVTSKFVDKDDW